MCSSGICVHPIQFVLNRVEDVLVIPVKCIRLKHLRGRILYQASSCSHFHLFAIPTMRLAAFLDMLLTQQCRVELPQWKHLDQSSCACGEAFVSTYAAAWDPQILANLHFSTLVSLHSACWLPRIQDEDPHCMKLTKDPSM